MADVIMPKMSDSMEEGKVLRWIKSQGEQVDKGEAIAEIETDKANVELESPDSGVLGDIRAQEGESVPVGTVIAVVAAVEEVAGVKGGAAAEAPPKEEVPPAQPQPEAVAEEEQQPPPAPEERPAPAAPPAPEAREAPAHPHPEGVKASPLARKIAQDAGVDLSEVRGTGPGGRIVEADVRDFIQRGGKPHPAAPKERPAPPVPPIPPQLIGKEMEVGHIWQVVARRMTESKQQAPHFYVTIEADMDEALQLRKWLNSGRPEDRQISVNDIVIKACAVTLLRHPTINASYAEENRIELHDAINIGIAVALPNGLIAPVIRNCERKSLSVISEEARELIARTREGKITPQDYEGGTFTISNLGMYGVDEFIAIINPPQAAILAVGAAMPKPVVMDDTIEIRNRMRLTCSGDHRVTDGARVAEFLRDLKEALEQPWNLLE